MKSSKDYDPLNLRGLEMTNTGTDRVGRITGRAQEPDHVILAGECPGAFPDTGVAETIGRLLNWPESRIDAAISSGLRAGVFRPE